jgi:hypothetical protein
VQASEWGMSEQMNEIDFVPADDYCAFQRLYYLRLQQPRLILLLRL